ncbi:hypothetical protein [Deinococcus indicus]|uniref:hypothetical protein n=1 Tax=Deinococcus indicus TaxID=223556 RepID=UPI00155482CA|nr:hypothetical protein [Deinococcus indicus]
MDRRTSIPLVLAAGFVGVMVFTVSVIEVAAPMRGWDHANTYLLHLVTAQAQWPVSA